MKRHGLAVCIPLLLLLCFSSPADGASRVYVANYGSDPPSASGYQRAGDGSLNTLAGSPFSLVSGPPYPVAGVIGLGFVPDGSVAVASHLFLGGASSVTVAADGSMTPAGPSTLTPSVTGLAISPDGRFAYLPTRTFNAVPAQGIIALAIAGNGTLSPLPGSPYGGPTELGDIAVTPDGKFLFAASLSGIRRFSISGGGALTEILPVTVTPEPPTSLVPSPDGRRLFAGLYDIDGSVASFTVGADGSLSQNGTPISSGGSSLGYFDVTPDGRNLYLPESNSDQIVRASVAADGSLSVSGSTPAEEIDSVGVAPDGEYLYAARDNFPGKINVALIEPDGSLQFQTPTADWESGEPERIVFSPGVTPTASFKTSRGAPGAITSFDATASQDADSFDWDFGDGTVLRDGGANPQHTYSEAGNYTVRLTVADAQGCSVDQIYSGQSTRCEGGSRAATESRVAIGTKPRNVAPRIESLSLTRKTITPRSKRTARRSTVFRYRISEAARIRITARRKVTGRRVNGKCRKQTKANLDGKKCVLRFRTIGSIRRSAVKGQNRTRFRGVVTGRTGKKIRLKPGTYRMTMIAIDKEGLRSKPASRALKVLRGRR